MSVGAVVVAHGPEPELQACLSSLVPEVDELVLVANAVDPLPSLPADMLIVQIERPQGYAANANRGIAMTSSEFVVVCNTDAIATPGSVRTLRDFAAARPRAGVVGPELLYPDGSWQAARRSFPKLGSTLLRRPPLRYLFKPERWQRAHYLLDDQSSTAIEADWMMGAFLLLRREMLDELGGFDEGFRLYGEDIDLAYRAARAGWERWYVPQAEVVHVHQAVTDRQWLTRATWWHWRGIARFVRKHPERLRAL
jgi:N-acetylglucosaminyl-diphospho-decaprenol L-rhamnosyltransferase